MKHLGLLLLCGAHAIAASSWPARPDPKLTPGAIGHHSEAQVCQSNFSATIRHTAAALKEQVYREYGIRKHRAGDAEIDHRIPLSLDGADVLVNLWAQSYRLPMGAHEKDALEDRIHALVCNSHELTLAEGQGIFFSDWQRAYLKYFPKGKKP
jgi:hypothetical protein